MRHRNRLYGSLFVVALCAVVLVGGCSDDSSDGNGNNGGDGGPTPVDATGDSDDGPSGDARDDGDGFDGACEHRSETLGVFAPNVFLVVDKSDSMTGQKMTQLKSGLDQLADNVANKVRLGMSGFPIQSCCCTSKRLLPLGRHTAARMKMEWGGLTADGGTPTGAALYQVRQGGWLTADGDTHADRRRHAVVLVTDGKPNDKEVCEPLDVPVRSPVEEARKLKNGETSPKAPVYVVGFNSESDGSKLNEIAKAGGTDAPGSNRYFTVGDGGELSTTLESIAVERTACTRTLSPAPPPGSDVAVKLGGDALTEDGPNGFSYDESTGRVTLKGDSCQTVQTQSQNGIALNIEVGCPTCNVVGGSCDTESDCCGSSVCEQGTCTETCRVVGDDCTDNGQCCSDNCRTGGDLIGTCMGG